MCRDKEFIHEGTVTLYLMLVLLVASLVGCAPARQAAQQPEVATEVPADFDGAPMPISGLASVFADELTQWDVFDYANEQAGELKLRFPPVAGRGGDFTQWSFRMDGFDGSIRPKITGRQDLWEVRVNNKVATVRTVYPGQFDDWAIQSGDQRIVFSVRDYNLLEFWSTRGPGEPGPYQVYTRFEGDPRDWEVLDQTTVPITAAAQLAMIWLPVYMRLTAGR